jgi:hypothetical protein
VILHSVEPCSNFVAAANGSLISPYLGCPALLDQAESEARIVFTLDKEDRPVFRSPISVHRRSAVSFP